MVGQQVSAARAELLLSKRTGTARRNRTRTSSALRRDARLPFNRWRFSDRNLVERRFFDDGNKATRYRNRAEVERVFKVKDKDTSVFLADEVFYESDVKAWTSNRIYVGARHDFTNRFSAEIYYFRQNGAFDRPRDLHVVGTTFDVRLR